MSISGTRLKLSPGFNNVVVIDLLKESGTLYEASSKERDNA